MRFAVTHFAWYLAFLQQFIYARNIWYRQLQGTESKSCAFCPYPQGYFTWMWAPSQVVVNHSCFIYEMRTWLQLEMRQKPAHPVQGDFLIWINYFIYPLYCRDLLKVIVQFYFGFRKYVWLLSSQISSFLFCCLILVMSLPVSRDICNLILFRLLASLLCP